MGALRHTGVHSLRRRCSGVFLRALRIHVGSGRTAVVRSNLLPHCCALLCPAVRFATAKSSKQCPGRVPHRRPSPLSDNTCCSVRRYAYLMLAVEMLGAAAVLLCGLAITRRAPRLPAARKERWKADPEDQGGGWSIQVCPFPGRYLGPPRCRGLPGQRARSCACCAAAQQVPAQQTPQCASLRAHGGRCSCCATRRRRRWQRQQASLSSQRACRPAARSRCGCSMTGATPPRRPGPPRPARAARASPSATCASARGQSARSGPASPRAAVTPRSRSS